MIKKLSLVSVFVFFFAFLVSFLFSGFSSIPSKKFGDVGSSGLGLFSVPFDISSKSVILVNLDTDSVIYEKNANERLPMASLTKLVTALVVLDNVKDIENIRVPVRREVLRQLDGTGSSLCGIKDGDDLTVLQLLHGLLITSGNDAALVLADFVGNGSVEKFVSMMNNKVAELGCENTHFTNPHGLDDVDHYSTAKDLVKIAKFAMNIPVFTKIWSTVTSNILGSNRYPLVTTNSLIDRVRGGKLYSRFVTGGKTGFSSKAGKCLVSVASDKKYSYLCVVLGGFSENKENIAMLESKMLYEWAFSNLELKTLAERNVPLVETKLELAWGKKALMLAPAKDCAVMLPKDVLVSSINYDFEVPNFVKAPIVQGQCLGRAVLSYANSPVAAVDLVAERGVKRSIALLIFYILLNFLFSIWFKFYIFSMILIFIFLLFLKRRKISRKKKLKYSKRKYNGYHM